MMTRFQSTHLINLRTVRRRLLTRLAITAAVLIPAGTILALSGSGGSPSTTGDNRGSSLRLKVEQHSQHQSTPSNGEPSVASNDQTIEPNNSEQQGSSKSVSQHAYISTSTSGNTTSTSAKVNGHDIHIPASGTVHKTIKSDGGETTIDVSSSGTNTSSNGASLNMNISSSSSSSSDEAN